MCAHVMQANREETLRPTSLSAHLYGFYRPAALANNAPQTEKLSSQSLGHRRSLSPAGFDLILLIRDRCLNHIAEGRQAHT